MRVYFMFLLAWSINSGKCSEISFANCNDCSKVVNDVVVFDCQRNPSEIHTLRLSNIPVNVTGITVKNCKNLKVDLNYPINVQRPVILESLNIKNVDNLSFDEVRNLQIAPRDVALVNIRNVNNLASNMFKMPRNEGERRIIGQTKSITIKNSVIGTIKSHAITINAIDVIYFENVTIANVQKNAITSHMTDNSSFTMHDCVLQNIDPNAITIQAKVVNVTANAFPDIGSHVLNITSEKFHMKRNKFKNISENGLVLNSNFIEIIGNEFDMLKTGAFSEISCSKVNGKLDMFSFENNRIIHLEPHSFTINYPSCKTCKRFSFRSNVMNCRCENLCFLNQDNSELSSIITNVSNNNTCLSAPCYLPVDVIKTLTQRGMCRVPLDPGVMCILYNEGSTTVEENPSLEEITEPSATFYLIRPAEPKRDNTISSVDKDNLLKDSHMNMTNRTTVKIVFDASRNFEENLRNTKNSHLNTKVNATAVATKKECSGKCNSGAVEYDRQKALEFYKYVYAQLRQPQTDAKDKTDAHT